MRTARGDPVKDRGGDAPGAGTGAVHLRTPSVAGLTTVPGVWATAFAERAGLGPDPVTGLAAAVSAVADALARTRPDTPVDWYAVAGPAGVVVEVELETPVVDRLARELTQRATPGGPRIQADGDRLRLIAT